MEADDTLMRAAEDIAQHGHAKETFFESTAERKWMTAPACAVGAIARVTGHASKGNGIVREEIFNHEAVKKLAAMIRSKSKDLAGAEDYVAVTGYNDDDRTTAEDMILMMKEAAHG
jgi:hypothetical protein